MKRAPELVVVTGGGSGIGRATALRFARGGATSVVLDVNPDTAEETAEMVRSAGGRAHAYQLDVADAPAFEELADHVRREHGTADVVVNNAGIVIGGSFLDHSLEDWTRTLNIHLMGVVHGSRLFGAQMAERGTGGHIVNLSSVGGVVPFQLGPAYCTAKAAIRHLSECLAVELAPHDIGVTAICPGLINTNLPGSTELRSLNGAAIQSFAAAAPRVARFGGSPDGVARAIEASVRRNRVITPVRAEAWAGFALMRLSPELVMTIMRVATRENAERLVPLLAGALR